MQFNFKNVNDAFETLVRGIHDGTIPTVRKPSRVGDVLQIEEPVIICYENPKERVLFNTERDANPFMHAYEALWMLAGRNDIASLEYYSKNYRAQVDDGNGVANGAYGYRWRVAKGGETDVRWDSETSVDMPTDQLKVIVEHLKKTPGSRRVVLQMWNVEDDLIKIDTSRDVCCLAPEVKFRSPEGDTSIRDLAEKFQTEKGFKFPVYAVDVETGDQRISLMTNAWRTGIKQVFRLTFDDGSTIRLTGNHVVFRKRKVFEGKRCVGLNIEEVQVCDLEEGDSLLAELPKDATSRTSAAGYRLFKRNLYKNTTHQNMILEHREYVSMFEKLKEYKKAARDGHSIHHKDGNKLNNKLENLEQLQNSEHFSIGMQGKDNAVFKMDPETKKRKYEEHSKIMRERSENMDPEFRKALVSKLHLRTEEQKQLVADYHSAKSNHKIVKIERAGVVPVYDFTVPGRHNAVLDNGVVVHNCNLCVLFTIRDTFDPTDRCLKIMTVLDMTVYNRSNDLCWGALGANIVHFSFLQEYVANKLEIGVGKYYQITNNLHVYTERFQAEKWLSWKPKDYQQYGVEAFQTTTDCNISLVSNDPNLIDFDLEVKWFADDIREQQYWTQPFLRLVAWPMLRAFKYHKDRDYDNALKCISFCRNSDWRRAGTDWLTKRRDNYLLKGAEQ